ncbi:MAG: DUF1080 domain-containing protein [Firmicutes bacterium]|nr:DUF1080 domain-containing protein [Bacillota bacterium]
MNFRKWIFISMSLVLVVLMLSGCNLFARPNGTINGLVTMSDGETPLDAKVFVDGKEKITAGKDGKFELSLKPGSYKVHAEFSGVKSDAVDIDLTNKGTDATLVIAGLGKINGTLKTADGLALGDQSFKIGSVDVTTTADGKYESIIAYGTLPVAVNYKGHQFSKDVEIKSGENDLVVDDLKEITLALKTNSDELLVGYNAVVKVGSFETKAVADEASSIKFIGVTAEGQLTVSENTNLLLPNEVKYVDTVTVDFANATEAVLGIVLCDFEEDFEAGLENWTEEEAWFLNDWQETIQGINVNNGVLKRDEFVPNKSSGVKLNGVEIGDAIVALRVRTTEEREGTNTGLRIHLRNNSTKFNKGYGVNVSAYSYALENWLGDAGSKGVTKTPETPTPQLTDDTWATITIIVEGHTTKYYKNGELVDEITEIDTTKQHTDGGLFLEFNGALEIDTVRIYHL